MTSATALGDDDKEVLKSILVIDDDEDDIWIISERLKEIIENQHTVISCADKEQAVSFLKSNEFDLCLLDYRLGYFDGIEVLKALQNVYIKTPVIMLTGQDDAEVESLAIKIGAQDYIMKESIGQDAFAKSIRYAVSRKELEIARISNERFQSENIAKDKFIAHLSHELRTPLTSIIGYTALLLENDMAAPLQKELNIISNNGNHLLNLLNDVLDLSKISAGKFELQTRETQFHQLLAEVYSLLSVNALDKGLSLKCRSDTPIAEVIHIDELRLKQVLINLIGNAIKFTDQGKVTLTISQMDNRTLIMTIADTGIGMNSEQIETIFQPFRQIEDVTNRRAGGAGLGLSISAEIVNQMNGSLDVTSVVGKGTQFVFTLPISIPEGTVSSHFDYNLYREITSSQLNSKLRGRVLIVDDVFEIRQLLGYHVRQTGCEVEFARNGKAALEILRLARNKNEPFDLVLMDLHMPIMTGVEAMIEIKKQIPKLPVVAITAAIQKGTKASLLEIGFRDLLSKPIERDKLEELLEYFLETNSQKDTEEQPEVTLQACLVEDDNDSAAIMQMLLSRLGFDVVHFALGQSCLDKLPSMAVDVFLVDLGLPDVDGAGLLGKIRMQHPSAKIYIISGSNVEASLITQYSLQGHLLKPVSFKQLKMILSEN